MATPLDAGVGILAAFRPVFVWLLIVAMMYALLSKINFFGKGDNILWLHLLIAFVIATLFVMTPGLTQVISTATPWIMVLVLVIVFIMFIFMFAGVKESAITENVFMDSTYIWIIVIVALGIFGFALSQVYGEAVQSITTDGGDRGVLFDIAEIVFSPKLLGVLLILVIASQTIRLVVK